MVTVLYIERRENKRPQKVTNQEKKNNGQKKQILNR